MKISVTYNQIIWFILLVIIIVFLMFAYRLNLNTISMDVSQSEVKESLIEEFNNAYSEGVDQTGEVVEYRIVAEESEVEILPGVKTKVFAYNGIVPGPELDIQLGDTLRVEFINNLPQSTTIHWHGVRVPNAMDGVPGVTQDPIEPGETFIYEFTPKDAGTFWFHPHVRGSEQLERGLYGTLIVRNPEVVYDFDQTLVLDDWLLENSGQIYPQFNTMHDLMHDGRWGNVISVNGEVQPEISLPQNAQGLLRIVNTSNARVYSLELSDDIAKIVAVDGMTASRFTSLERFTLSPGGRVDLLIDTNGLGVGNRIQLVDTFTRKENLLAEISMEVSENISKFSGLSPAYIPNWEQADELSVDKVYDLNASRRMMNVRWMINGAIWPNVSRDYFKKGELVKLRFKNSSTRLHPMHIHGQFFKVVARNDVPLDEPYWRDTVLVSSREVVDIIMIPQDNGDWVNHCHIQEHSEAGMMTSFEVK